MISPPTYNIPRELISYILAIKSYQAWKLRLPKLHKIISHAAVPEEIENDSNLEDIGYHYFHYGNNQPISKEYAEKHIRIEIEPGRESESDDDGEHHEHLDLEIEIACTKVHPFHYMQHDTYDCDNCNNELLFDDDGEFDYEDRCSDWYPNEDNPDRFTSTISFTAPLWRKQHGHWCLY